ncbi:hypothetical protein BY996DRAFT_6419760 [Phakopsora pachyrhizi]|nr:hypothetical protein BY996DRAFT_6419760 [Phakopsora pachyrhizi]
MSFKSYIKSLGPLEPSSYPMSPYMKSLFMDMQYEFSKEDEDEYKIPMDFIDERYRVKTLEEVLYKLYTNNAKKIKSKRVKLLEHLNIRPKGKDSSEMEEQEEEYDEDYMAEKEFEDKRKAHNLLALERMKIARLGSRRLKPGYQPISKLYFNNHQNRSRSLSIAEELGENEKEELDLFLKKMRSKIRRHKNKIDLFEMFLLNDQSRLANRTKMVCNFERIVEVDEDQEQE